MPDEIHESIRAKRFELVDDSERTRALMYWDGEHTAALEFFEDGQIPRISLGINPEGTSTFTLYDTNGTIRARIATEWSGEPTVFTIRDATNRIRAQIAMDESSAVGISLTDQWGQKRTSLETAPDGHTSLVIYDEDGNYTGGIPGADPGSGQ